MLRNLLGALDEADQVVCSKCHSRPASGSKLHCGRCRSSRYCNKQCAKGDWAEHKLERERLHEEKEEAPGGTGGGGQKISNFWLKNLPGLNREVTLMAWNHRSQEPLIHAWTSGRDVDGSRIRLRTLP